MYFDHILFIISTSFAVVALGFFIYLIASHKRSRVYAKVLRHDAESGDTLTSTMSKSITGLTLNTYTNTDDYFGTETSNHVNSDKIEDHIEHAFQVGGTDLLNLGRVPNSGSNQNEGVFDSSVLAGAYSIVREIGGGNMSRTFEVNNIKLGNPWFLKFISSKEGKLVNEENILKQLNHISLPKIVDVIYKDEGVYLIETLIDGISLSELINKNDEVNQSVLVDWFGQLAHVLDYLSNIKPAPILHLDLKPGNIMLTHANRLVLVDFGISRNIGEQGQGALTAKYAAPEQFSERAKEKYAKLINMRFGAIPDHVGSGDIDVRTDIYSLGAIMFELVTGQPPTQDNPKLLEQKVSRELCEIILKCIAIEPSKRYSSASKLQEDIRELKGSKIMMARTLFLRKVAKFVACLAIFTSLGSFFWGYTVFAAETSATLLLHPDVLTLSLQQSATLDIERYMADGSPARFDINRVVWDFAGDDVARIDGTLVTGLNLGETFINGQYRNRSITLHVRVVEPIDDLVEVSQKFQTGRTVSVFTGTFTKRESIDGDLENIDFFSPESIAVSDNGAIYITDAGIIRRIDDATTETISISPAHISAARIVAHGNNLYILTDPWQDEDDYVFAIARIDDNGNAEKLITFSAQRSAVEDFSFSQDGTLYFVERNEGLGGVFLHTLTTYGSYITPAKLPQGSSSLAINDEGIIYIGNIELGVIYAYYQGELRYFAGLEGDRAFIDGFSSRFYYPQRLKYFDGYLYVWDFNTLRRIEAFGPVAGDTMTIAGIASPIYDNQPSRFSFAAEDIVFPHGRMMDFIVIESGILLTDHKCGVVWLIDR